MIEVGLEPPRRLDGLGHRPGLGDDLEARPAVEHGDEALADDLVVVDDQERQSPDRCVGHEARLPSVSVWSSAASSAGRRISIVVPERSLARSMVAPMVPMRERMLTRPW